MTIYIDLLLEIQNELAIKIQRRLDERTTSVTTGKRVKIKGKRRDKD